MSQLHLDVDRQKNACLGHSLKNKKHPGLNMPEMRRFLDMSRVAYKQKARREELRQLMCGVLSGGGGGGGDNDTDNSNSDNDDDDRKAEKLKLEAEIKRLEAEIQACENSLAVKRTEESVSAGGGNDDTKNEDEDENKANNTRLGVFPDRDYIAVGDIHGDYDTLKHLLVHAAQVARVVEDDTVGFIHQERLVWTGGDKMLVFTGDLIDPKRNDSTAEWTSNKRFLRGVQRQPLSEEMMILGAIKDLDVQARKEGGRVIKLVGNHELQHFAQQRVFAANYGPSPERSVVEARLEMFKSGGVAFRRLRNYVGVDKKGEDKKDASMLRHLACISIGNTVLCHGGVTDKLADLLASRAGAPGLSSIQDVVTQTNAAFQHLMEVDDTTGELRLVETVDFPHSSFAFRLLYDEPTSPFWNRTRSDDSSTGLCSLDEKWPFETRDGDEPIRHVVGHTGQPGRNDYGAKPASVPSTVTEEKDRFVLSGALKQKKKGCISINAMCSGNVWRIDAFMSQGFDIKSEDSKKCMLGSRAPQCLSVDKGHKNVRVFLSKTMAERPNGYLSTARFPKGPLSSLEAFMDEIRDL